MREIWRAPYCYVTCCVCGDPAVLFDTEYDEAYCEEDARRYGLRRGQWNVREL